MIPESTSVFSPASPQGREILGLFWIVLGIAGVIFLVVTTLVVIAAIRFRERPGGPPPSTTEENLVLEWIWTAIPSLILAVLFVLTVRVMHQVDPNPGNRDVDLEIVAHQWWWELHYPGYGVTSANEFHLPVKRKLLLRLESADVVHDFWVPALGKKVDAIPGHPNSLTLTIDHPGTFLGTCDEFCGAEHARMRIRVIGQSEDEFVAWAEHQASAAVEPSSPDARRGAKLFQQRTCASCHTIQGTPARGRVGPDLTHVASRETLASGVLANTPENLSRWIADPQAIKPGCQMPDLHLDPSEVQLLTAYLKELS
jgi:cytochrome c oxidase subunit 2